MWDSLFLEGPKVLHRTALALLKSREPELLAFDNAGELTLAARAAASGAHDRDALMRAAFEGVGSLPMAVIERARGRGSREVEAEAREREAARCGSASGAASPRHAPQQHGGAGEGGSRDARPGAGVRPTLKAARRVRSRNGWLATRRSCPRT